jgi:hypothetical protein
MGTEPSQERSFRRLNLWSRRSGKSRFQRRQRQLVRCHISFVHCLRCSYYGQKNGYMYTQMEASRLHKSLESRKSQLWWIPAIHFIREGMCTSPLTTPNWPQRPCELAWSSWPPHSSGHPRRIKIWDMLFMTSAAGAGRGGGKTQRTHPKRWLSLNKLQRSATTSSL